MGGASGGFTSGKKSIISVLRQKSRPYLFSNSLSPSIVCASIAAIDIISNSIEKIKKLKNNTKLFRTYIEEAGFTIKKGIHPIIPIMIGDASKAHQMADALLERGIYVIGFFFPVVPKGEARIRVQISANHSRAQLDHAIQAFINVGKKYKVV